MCFSATASFTASAVLAVIGCGTLKNVSSRSQVCLASIPLLFGIQQFAEGLLWLHFNGELPLWAGIWLPNVAQYLYLAIAFLLWPIWIPLSLHGVEEIELRKKILFLFVLAGVCLGLYTIAYGIGSNITSQASENSIQYQSDFSYPPWIYVSIVLIPCFISSFKGMKIFGLLALVSVLIAWHLYFHAFTSVWCFFAAIISIYLYLVIRKNGRK
jgi:hypothetical protein